MTTFQSLPIEIQHQCVQHFDVKMLKAFRLASRKACAIATEYLFGIVALKFHEESVKKFNHVLGDEALKAMVKKVVVDGSDGTREELYEYDDYDEETGDRIQYVEGSEEETRIPTPWAAAMSEFVQFPGLCDAELRLHDECYHDGYPGECYHDGYPGDCEQDPEYRIFYQNRFFEALKDAQGVNSLTLKNIQDGIVGMTGSEEATEKVRSRLKQFHIMIATEGRSWSPESSIESENFHQCFNSTLKSHWLKPLQAQLTHLTIYCDTYWGVFPFMDLREVHFPSLVSLTLGNWSIAHDWQLDWLMSHGDSLQQLILDDCPIIYALWMPEDMVAVNWPEMLPSSHTDYIGKLIATRWSDVFPKFQQRLRKLKHFAMGHGDWHDLMFERRYDLPARIESTRYVAYYHGCGPSQWLEDGLYDTTLTTAEGIKVEVEILSSSNEQSQIDQKALNEFLKEIGTSDREIEMMKDLIWNWREKQWLAE